MSESPGNSTVATTKCKMGTARHSRGTTGAPTIAHRYWEEEYAVQIPLDTARQGDAVREDKSTGNTVGGQDDVGQYVYQKGETSADEVTTWQQEAYNDHLIQGVRQQLWNARTTHKVIMNRDDTYG